MATKGPALHLLAVKSAMWYGATRLWGQGVSWAVTLLLARLLIPGDYGLFAIALSVLAILELLQEFGLGTAIVQRQDLKPAEINGMFWIVTVSSFLLTAAVFAAAGPISRFYAEPHLMWILRILCLTFFVNSLSMVPYNLLTKAIDLRHRSLAEALGTTASALVALGLAWFGYGVWALVYGHLARSIVITAAVGVCARWSPGLELDFGGMRSIIAFGIRVAGTHFVGSLSPTATTFILARVLGATAVGLFSMAQGLADGPHRVSTAVINQLSLPVFSKLQSDTPTLRGYFLKISKYVVAVSVPIQTGLVLVAPDLVPVLLSSKWAGIVVPFQLFCLESMFVTFTLTCSPLLIARDRAHVLFVRSVISMVALCIAAAAGAPLGLVGVAAARLIVMIPLRLSILIPSLRDIGLTSPAYLRNVGPQFASASVMAAVVLVAQHALPSASGHAENLLWAVSTGALTYVGVSLCLDAAVRREVKTVFREVLPISHARAVEP